MLSCESKLTRVTPEIGPVNCISTAAIARDRAAGDAGRGAALAGAAKSVTQFKVNGT
jgi:hypothetical protein